MQVKANQKLLLKQIQANTAEDRQAVDVYIEQTKKRGRTEIRKIFVYKNLFNISPEWTALKRLIRVERHVCDKKRQRDETAYYISDIRSNKAVLFGKHIRNHWGIENRLHWVKDVIMKEDDSKIKMGMAPENISILRNIVCNLFRSKGLQSIKYAMELYANNVKDIFELINSKTKVYKIT